MGRAFEYRKASKMKRWSAMAKNFTRAGKEIAMAVKTGGPNPDSNAKLRIVIQNAKGFSMPKDKIEAAIKRASSREEKDYAEASYEGYGPFGVAIFVECATDNSTRTVANVRHYFSKMGGSLGTSGSLEFIFDRKAVFRLKNEGLDLDELELELIDHGLDKIELDEEEIIIYTNFQDFGTMQSALDARGLEILSSNIQRIPTTTKALDDEQAEVIIKLIDMLEEDDDVMNVYHNME